MRKKFDPLLLLAVLVTSGVILSHFVVFSQVNKQSMDYSRLTPAADTNRISGTDNPWQKPPPPVKSRQLARIDLLRQQTH